MPLLRPAQQNRHATQAIRLETIIIIILYRAAFIMYTTVEGQRILGGVLIILKRKGEIVKISEGRKPVMPFVSDATESLIICNIDEQIHK